MSAPTYVTFEQSPPVMRCQRCGAKETMPRPPIGLAQFIDVVASGAASLALSRAWLPRCLDACPRALLAAQDGMRPADVTDLIGGRVGVFIGGTTAWKLETLAAWCEFARERGVWCHVGRVNSERRITRCAIAGATSFDGSSASRFAVTLARLDRARRQGVLAFGC